MPIDIFMELGEGRGWRSACDSIFAEADTFGFTLELLDPNGDLFLVLPHDERDAFFIERVDGIENVEAPFGLEFRLKPKNPEEHVWLSCIINFVETGIVNDLWIQQGGVYTPRPDDSDYPLARRVYTFIRRLHEVLDASSTEASDSVSGYIFYWIRPHGDEKDWI